MKKLRRAAIFISTLAVSAGLFCFSACGGTTSDDSSSKNSDSETPSSSVSASDSVTSSGGVSDSQTSGGSPSSDEETSPVGTYKFVSVTVTMYDPSEEGSSESPSKTTLTFAVGDDASLLIGSSEPYIITEDFAVIELKEDGSATLSGIGMGLDPSVPSISGTWTEAEGKVTISPEKMEPLEFTAEGKTLTFEMEDMKIVLEKK